MTKRLYYADSYLKEFPATVLDCRRINGIPAAVLDQTAFYPESGGQPSDTGILQDVRVMNVLEDGTGTILHILDHDIAPGPAIGRIDWTRRFDHMQQHTGQHILSQAFLHVAQAPTVSFHMGAEISTIDIDLAQPSASLMEDAQNLATNIVFENHSVHILTTDRDNLGSLGVRKESQRAGEIRVIDVEGFDRSPCGGTHVRYTGEIGLVFITGYERYKGGTRVEFAAGGRALKVLNSDHSLLKNLARLHSAIPDDLPALTEKLFQERASQARENELLREKLLEIEAERLIQSAGKNECGIMVCRSFTDRKLDAVKILAQKLTAGPGVIAILGIPDACQIVVARSRDLAENCGEAIKKTAAELGGKGGGRPELAQAGGFSADSFEPWMKALQKYFGN